MPQPIHLVVEGDWIVLSCAFEDRDTAKSVPGYRWDAASRSWRYPKDTVTAVRLVRAFTGRSIEANAEMQALVYTATPRQEAVAATLPADLTITTGAREIRVATKPRYADLMKRVPAYRWDPQALKWVWPKSPSIAADMVRAWGNRGLQIKSDDGFQALFNATVRLTQAASMRDSTNLPNIPGIQTEAWQHQRQAYYLVASIWGATQQEQQSA